MSPDAERDALCRIAERFPRYGLDNIGELLDEDQIDALMTFIAKNPTTSTRMVEWGK